MSIADSSTAINPNSLAGQLSNILTAAMQCVQNCTSIRDAERFGFHFAIQFGAQILMSYIQLHGNGDHGETITTSAGEVLHRSKKPHRRVIRTVFGEYQIEQYVYGKNPGRKIDCYPVDVAMEMPEDKYSPWLREIIHYLCVKMSYQEASKIIELIFQQRIPVDSLERITRNQSDSAEQYINEMPMPAPEDEGEILVVSADAKGVPMVRKSKPHPAFEKREFPENRQMATLAAVYTVDKYIRTPEQIVAALFRENTEKTEKRPEPVGKVVAGYLSRCDAEGVLIRGTHRATVWAAELVERRHQPGQRLVRLMDGQPSLWEASDVNFEMFETIDILDIIHVAGYVWKAAKEMEPHREYQEAFARDRLLRILNGEVKSVTAGLRQMATKRQLKGKHLKTIENVCNYLEKNSSRMQYDEYLRQGLPIATGVIEGACRHLVMDRMCRTGMRWKEKGAQAMLHARAIDIADRTRDFHVYLANREYQRTSEFRKLLNLPHLPPLCG